MKIIGQVFNYWSTCVKKMQGEGKTENTNEITKERKK